MSRSLNWVQETVPTKSSSSGWELTGPPRGPDRQKDQGKLGSQPKQASYLHTTIVRNSYLPCSADGPINSHPQSQWTKKLPLKWEHFSIWYFKTLQILMNSVQWFQHLIVFILNYILARGPESIQLLRPLKVFPWCATMDLGASVQWWNDMLSFWTCLDASLTAHFQSFCQSPWTRSRNFRAKACPLGVARTSRERTKRFDQESEEGVSNILVRHWTT